MLPQPDWPASPDDYQVVTAVLDLHQDSPGGVSPANVRVHCQARQHLASGDQDTFASPSILVAPDHVEEGDR